jgi:hypothetical protein
MTRLVSLLPCLALGACVAESQNTILILHNKIPDEMCVIPTDESAAYSSTGMLDLEVPTQDFTFTPLLRSNAQGDPVDPNRHVFIIEGADIELEGGSTQRSQDLVNGLGALKNRTQRTSGSIGPNGLTSIAYLVVDSEQSQALAAGFSAPEEIQIIARSSVYGTIDGNSVSSPFFAYPITLCKGCIQSYDPVAMVSLTCFGDQRP